MINVVDVSYHYSVQPVLRGISLTVNRGELVALMGPNGMGKSTLMAVIAGAISPYKGYVQIDGMTRRSSEDDEMAIRKKVFYLPAEPWLPMSYSGRTWLVAVGKLYDVNDDRVFDHVERLLKLFDLQEKADSPMAGYSTGQKKKLALCTALVSEASILLLDEPFSGGLDPSGILALKRVLQGLAQREDKTVLLATPVPELVEELADRVAMLKDGQIIAYDTAKNLCANTHANSLADAYERLVNPQTQQNIAAYLRGSS